MDNQTEKTQEILNRGVADLLPDRKGLLALMAKRKIRVYLGIDPTGAFLTLGHSVVLRKLQQFADLGHDVILLIGNGTVKIGDPTGRDSSRPVLTDEQIEANFKNWKEQASKILDFSKITIRHNGDWLDKLTYTDMIRLLASTTVTQLLERDMFQDRMKNNLPIHGHEIIYPLLQGYDSVMLDVDLEIGGTDQMFNMMMGRNLQKSENNKEKWVLTTPIIDGLDGRKMSKSFNNYVALTDKPNDMFGKLMRIPDKIIVDYYTLLTDEPLENIAQIKKNIASGSNPMVYKKNLAHLITKMYHSQAEADAAQKQFESVVQNKELPDEIETIFIDKSFANEASIFQILQKAMPTESNSNLRRLIEQSGVELLPDNYRPQNFTEKVAFKPDMIIRVGKRRFFQFEFKKHK